MARLAWVMGALCTLALGCGSAGSKTPPVEDPGGGGGEGGGGGGAVVAPPIVNGDLTFYGAAQGLTADIRDVSADEGGNVYVAGSEALFVKKAGTTDFVRVDGDKAGLTKSCWPESEIANPGPPGAPTVCPIISVAGASAGRAFVGFKGVGSDDDYDAPWALDSGGMDLVTFDGTAVKRERHVLVASPPKTVCEHWDNSSYPATPWNTVCAETWSDSTWMAGRKKMRQIQRLVVNHDRSRPLSYGDVYVGATHGTIGVLVANPKDRGWPDLIKGAAGWDETHGVWEHHHPDPPSTDGGQLAGEGWALALDPLTNVPWYANQVRMARFSGYGESPAPDWRNYWGPQDPPEPGLMALWYPALPADRSIADMVSSMSFCDDGTLWVASSTNGLARVTIDRAAWGKRSERPWAELVSISYVNLPSGLGSSALAVACDPTDDSVWVGFGWGGFGRYKGGQWWIVPNDAPKLAHNPVRSIQIDRWSSPRVVWFAHTSSRLGPGGVTACAGP